MGTMTATQEMTGDALSVGIVSTYPPTECGLATFSAALANGLRSCGEDAAARSACRVGVVELVDQQRISADDVVFQVVRDDMRSVTAAASWLNGFDAVVVQHEYGIFGGVDGDDVLGIVDGVDRPIVTVLHTVLDSPSPHQREVLEALCRRSATIVVMTYAARARLIERFTVEPRRVVVIPHGAHENRSLATDHRSHAQPTVLTWGLLGPGKGIEAGIEAMSHLRSMIPPPRYVVAGQTHPKVREASGEAYRDSLKAHAREMGVAHMVHFDDEYRDLTDLKALIRSADVVLLPYESRDQVTSGVLIEAVASGKPVVSTDFPHARELLSSGAGIVVPHGSTEAMSSALERVLHDHRLARSMAAEAARISAPTMWDAVARRYLDVLVGLAVSQPRFSDLDLPFDRRDHVRTSRVDYTSHVA